MWVALKLATPQRIAPMKHRQDQLGLDGAIAYRELHEAHPEVERGPDEDMDHHFSRLRAAERMSPKLATKRPRRRQDADPEYVPPDVLQRQLGPEYDTSDAIAFSRLRLKHPDLDQRHEEDTASFYERLKREDAKPRSGDAALTEKDQAAVERGRAGLQEAPAPDWMKRMLEQSPTAAPAITDLKGLPQRIPGLFTNDSWAHGTIPDQTPPPQRDLPQRYPGTHYVDPALQAAPPGPRRPRTQEERARAHTEWVQGLADKGIYLNPDGSRMTPEEMQLPLRYPGPNGPRVWQQFVDRSPETPAYAGRHRQAVAAYIREKLAGIQDKMEAAGWTAHRDAGGGLEHYEKQIGDRIHVIVPQPGGYIHNYAPAYSPKNEYGEYELMGDTPVWHDRLQDAVMSAERGGKTHHRMVDRTKREIEDSSFQPDRMGEGASKTKPYPALKPEGPGPFGKFQTLNSVSFTWEDQ